MKHRFLLLTLTSLVLLSPAPGWGADDPLLSTPARFRQPIAGTTGFEVGETNLVWDLRKTAVVVCDMWDVHWCKGASRRVAEMAPRMNEVIKAARARGAFIIHCPSGTLKHYEGTPQRALAQAAPPVTSRVPLQNWCSLDLAREAALPIDDSDGGCDDLPRCEGGSPWTRQIDTIEIREGDAVTDSAEAFYLMEQRGLENVIVLGVHANMCVLGRPFSIRQMINQGKNVTLMRDMTDSMYNSRMRPHVSHFRGTEMVVEHVEKHWCPTITSIAFLGGEPFRFKEDVRPRVVFVIGEDEYHTDTTLPEFARAELEYRGIDCEFVRASQASPNDFAGMEKVANADLVVLSVRRRTPKLDQLDRLRRHVEAGKPLVGIRTASHAFQATVPNRDHGSWPNIDREILGGHYAGHYNNKPPEGSRTLVRRAPGEHPILNGVPEGVIPVTSHLYKNREMASTTTTVMIGEVEGIGTVEPVAWVNTAAGRKVFYTSLGDPNDFRLPAFRRLLLNGILWSLDKPIPPAPAP